VIKGNNIILRKLIPEDALLLFQWENDPKTAVFTDEYQRVSIPEIEAFIEDADNIQENRQMRWMILEKATRRSLGTLDLYDISFDQQRAGIAILIADEKDRKQGFAYEAIHTFLPIGVETFGISNYFCSVQESNLPSVRLFEKLGFKLVGKREQWFRKNELAWESELLFQKIIRNEKSNDQF